MGEMKVKPQRKNEIIIGVLFLLATASYMIGSGLVETALKITDFSLINAEQIKMGILLELINSAAVVGIAALIFPILRKYGESLTMIYVSSRIIESALLLIAAIGPLLLITLNQIEAQQLNAMITLFASYSFQMAMISLSAGSIFFYLTTAFTKSQTAKKPYLFVIRFSMVKQSKVFTRQSNTFLFQLITSIFERFLPVSHFETD